MTVVQSSGVITTVTEKSRTLVWVRSESMVVNVLSTHPCALYVDNGSMLQLRGRPTPW